MNNMKTKKKKTERRIAYEKLRNIKNNNIKKKHKFIFENQYMMDNNFIESWKTLRKILTNKIKI